MTWFRVDDGWRNHPKVSALSMAARGLWVTCGNYCAEQLTDGHVDHKQIRKEGGTAIQIRDLVAAGLWVECESHPRCIRFHDWLGSQPSRESVLSRRTRDAELKAEAREAKKAQAAVRKANKSRIVCESHEDRDVIASESREDYTTIRSRIAHESHNENPPEQQESENVRSDIHADSALPDPTRPDPYLLVTSRGRVTSGTARVCPRHPNGNPTGEPCGGCADARRAAEAETAEALEAAKRTRSAEVRERATTKAAAIAQCDLCDDNGYRGRIVCDHIDHEPAAARGRAKIRAELDAIAARKSA